MSKKSKLSVIFRHELAYALLESKAAYVALPRFTTRRCPSSPHRLMWMHQYPGVFICMHEGSFSLPQHLAKQNTILAAGSLPTMVGHKRSLLASSNLAKRFDGDLFQHGEHRRGGKRSDRMADIQA